MPRARCARTTIWICCRTSCRRTPSLLGDRNWPSLGWTRCSSWDGPELRAKRRTSASYALWGVSRPVVFLGLTVEGPARSVWSGIFADAQAERGSIVYSRSCSGCHQTDLRGNSAEEIPALVGETFKDDWDNDSVGNLFERISTRMP